MPTRPKIVQMSYVLDRRCQRLHVCVILERQLVDISRIIVADDHPMFREGLCSLLHKLSPDAEVTQAGTYDEMLVMARTGTSPELFVLDLHYPGMELSKAVGELRQGFPLASIVIVSMSDDRVSADRIMAAGVDGFISKAATPDEMRAAFLAVQAGEFVNISSGHGLSVSDAVAEQFPALTDRHKEVLRLIVDGKSNKEIARDLDISPFTVRIHVSAVMRALGVDTRSAAAGVAAKYGF
jgi:DNA-binding NarL/FixJ family response regulator